MPYPKERILEDAAFSRELAPTRLLALLLPVWQVEVRATVTDGRPYELIERYIERGIAEGALGTKEELAAFLALDEPIVDRALRFLHAVGHVVEREGRLTLTELGRRSQRDDRYYFVKREDRRKLYFDAFASRPLTRSYYDAGAVTLPPADEVMSLVADSGQPPFQMLCNPGGFRREALRELANHTDRERYNLPVRIEQPESLQEDLVYLPLYVVRAVDRRGAVRYLAYSQAGAEADPEFTELCEKTPGIREVLDIADLAVDPERQESQVTEWCRRRGFEQVEPVRLDEGGWQVTLPAEAFGPKRIPHYRIGSFAVLSTCLLRIRCEDKELRERALLERVGSYVTRRSGVTAADLDGRVDRVARQLELTADVPEVRRMAADAGETKLAGRLDELLAGPVE
ncbi:hypothetical protein [Amycolatopsis samaneae]